MNRLWEIIHRYPLGSTLLALVMTAVLAPGLGNLRLNTSSEALLDPDSEEFRFYHQTLDEFGDDVQEIILVEAPDIFRTDILQAIENLTRKAEAIDGITRIVSLSNSNTLTGRDGVLSTDALIPVVPESEAELAALRAETLGNEVLVGEVINPEGTSAAIHLFVDSRPDVDGWAVRMVEEIETLLEEERARLGPGVRMFQIGSPYVKTELENSIIKDIRLLSPFTVVLSILLLWIFFRSGLAVVTPICTGLLSLIGTLGFMGYMGLDINPMNTILPPLILVVGAAEDIHMISEYAHSIADGHAKREAVLRMLRKTGLAICMTTLTTFGGFATLLLNHTPILYEFGLAASFGTAFNFVLTVLLVPALLQWAPVPRSWKAHADQSRSPVRRVILALLKRPVTLFLVFIALIVGSIWGATRMQVDTSYTRFFRHDAEVRQRYRVLGENLQGGNIYTVVVRTGREEGLYDPEGLRRLVRFQRFLEEKNEAEVLGFTDYLRKLNREMHDGDPGQDAIPDSRKLIAQYTLLLDPDDIGRFLNFDRSTGLFLVRSHRGGSQEMGQWIRDVDAYVREHLDPDWEVRLSGESVLVSLASDRIARDLVNNLGTMAAGIFIVMSLFLRSLRAGLVAMIPNLLPVAIVFGAMGWWEIPLSTATFPVALVALGIAVDNTVHLMWCYSQLRPKAGSHLKAVRDTLDQEIRPVLTTSVSICAGFMVLTLGEFASVAQFGILSALSMASAVACDLLITPLLLRLTPGASVPRPDR